MLRMFLIAQTGIDAHKHTVYHILTDTYAQGSAVHLHTCIYKCTRTHAQIR